LGKEIFNLKKGLFITSIFLMSCDCFQSASGTVVDAASGLPLSGVKVKNIAAYDTEDLTDQNGYFEKSEIGPASDCPELILRFEKEGYVTDTINPGTGNGKVIKLKKQ